MPRPKGFKHSEKTKRKIREAHKGKPLSERNHKSNCVCYFCKSKRGELKGKNSPNWKGGQTKDNKGYVRVLMPKHPRADSKGYVARACLIAEKTLGRYLYPEEIAHHKNEIRDDDRPENIEVKESRSAHTKYHRNL